MEAITESGLVITDRRHTRADDPRSWPPNENGAGVNTPPRTVGPTSSEGRYGNTNVMGPVAVPQVQAWSGWPEGWDTPNWQGQGGFVTLNEMAARVSVVFGCIDLNSSILSTMPPYRMRGQEMMDPLPWMENPQPEVYTGFTEAMKQFWISYWGGEVFVWATSRYADNSVRTWVVLNPAWVEITQRGQVKSYTMGGIDITEDVLHIRYASWPGTPHGIGPLEALANNLFGAAALEKYQSNLAARGGIPWGALTVPGNLSQGQAAELRDNFVSARLSAMGAPAVLSGGVTLTPFNINPKDMALLELRQFEEARIATLLGVPPLLMNLPTGGNSMTYQNAEGIYVFHWRAHLRPKATTACEAISQWGLVHGQRIELNRDEYIRPPLNDRIAGYETLFNMIDPSTGRRAMELDEVRAAERMITGSGTTVGGAITQ